MSFSINNFLFSKSSSGDKNFFYTPAVVLLIGVLIGGTVTHRVVTRNPLQKSNDTNSPDTHTVDLSSAKQELPTPPSPLPSLMPALTTPTSTPSLVTKEYGVWVWDSPVTMTSDAMKNRIQQIADNNFNVIYISIDDYLALTALPDGMSKNTQITQYVSSLEQFIILAGAKGIAVDAVAGDKDWAKPTVRWKPNALLEFTKTYNAAHANKLRSFQFDVEPYLLPEYELNKGSVLLDFVSFVDEMTTNTATSSLALSFVIPHFYDKDQQWTPAITYKGNTNYTFTHMLNILSQSPGSKIVVMAYRNFAVGTNGTIELARSEINEASAMSAGDTKIYVAQEAGDETPSYVTYFRTSLNYMNAEIAKVNSTFTDSLRFGGIAIHHIIPFLALHR
jgi:hypothetical protein